MSNSILDFPCDRLATDRTGSVYCMSVFGNSTALKALHAFLNSSAKGYMEIAEKEARMKMVITRTDGTVVAPSEFIRFETWGYKRYAQKMDYGMWHYAVRTKCPSFLPCISDEAIWQALMHPTYTTPLIPDWIPYIREKLVSGSYLKETFGFQVKCGFLNLKTKELDEIVCNGLKEGAIHVPRIR